MVGRIRCRLYNRCTRMTQFFYQCRDLPIERSLCNGRIREAHEDVPANDSIIRLAKVNQLRGIASERTLRAHNRCIGLLADLRVQLLLASLGSRTSVLRDKDQRIRRARWLSSSEMPNTQQNARQSKRGEPSA